MNDGGIFRSTNALAATPTFTQTLQAQIQRITFGVNGTTVLAATSESTASGNGRLRESTDGGATWPTVLGAADGFCGGQCFYDIAVGIDPQVAGPNLRIYLGGNARGTSSDGMKLSNNGGATFTRDDNGLHADTHAIAFDVSTNPSTVWTGNDGGVWKRSAAAAAGTLWTNLNNALATLQFQSVAVGKSDPFFGIGGTQDNGTEIQQTSLGNWSQADFGDGGFALIDQSTTSTTNVTMYHTYFNQTNTLIGFARTNLTSCARQGRLVRTRLRLRFRRTRVRRTTANAVERHQRHRRRRVLRADGARPGDAEHALLRDRPPLPVDGQGRHDGRRQPSADRVGRRRSRRSASRRRTTTCGSSASGTGRCGGPRRARARSTNVTSGSFPANPTGSTTNKWVGRAVIDPNNPDTAYVTFSFYAPGRPGRLEDHEPLRGNSDMDGGGERDPERSGERVRRGPERLDAPLRGHRHRRLRVDRRRRDVGAVRHRPSRGGRLRHEDRPTGDAHEKLRVATHGRSMWEISLSSPPPPGLPVADFDGDGDTDISVFRPSQGGWYIQGQPPFPQIWGALGDLSVPGDYDGNGTVDIAVFRNGQWYVKGQPPFPQIWGTSGDVPVPGDYDGNGTTDIAVFRNGQWYVQGQPPFPQIWGQAGDVPVPGDYDGNGTTDMASSVTGSGT